MKTKGTTTGRMIVMYGTWAVCRIGHGQELARVQAKTKLGALKRASAKLHIPAAELDALAILPTVFRVVEPGLGAPAAG